jgi:hypothetical protein
MYVYTTAMEDMVLKHTHSRAPHYGATESWYCLDSLVVKAPFFGEYVEF